MLPRTRVVSRSKRSIRASGEMRLQRFHDFFGPDAEEVQERAVTFLAFCRSPACVIAVMAAHEIGGLVIGHRDAAIRAFQDVPAFPAHQKGSVSATVLQQQDLLSF